jgi:hypothetical protein
MQPIVWDDNGVIRFQDNKIIKMLADAGVLDLNYIAGQCIEKRIPHVDQMQFWQLLGYSVSGFGSLSFVTKEMVLAADTAAGQLIATTVTPAQVKAPSPALVAGEGGRRPDEGNQPSETEG